MCPTSLISDPCAPPPAGVPGYGVALGVLHAAPLPGAAHLVELLPDPDRSGQSGLGESGAAFVSLVHLPLVLQSDLRVPAQAPFSFILPPAHFVLLINAGLFP